MKKKKLGIKKSAQKELFDIKEVIIQRVQNLENNSLDIFFKIDMTPTHVQINKKSYISIIDNLLLNAVNCTHKGGSVNIFYDNYEDTLYIKDSGKGFPNEGEGIDLYIVKKLCTELDIDFGVKSELGIGSTSSLTLR